MCRTGKYIFVYIIFISGFTFSVSAQPDLDKKITLITEKKPLISVLEEISEKGNINFSYIPGEIPLNREITLSAKEKTIKEILDIVSSEMDITYMVIEEQVILKPANKEEISDTSRIRENYTLSGYILDRETGEVLIGATVFIPELVKGTITNAYGFYSITLPEGDYNAEFSYVGYEKMTIPVRLHTNIPRNVRLERAVSSLKEVTVIADEDQLLYDHVQMSRMNLEPQAVKTMPALLGEVDVIKSLQSVGLSGINWANMAGTIRWNHLFNDRLFSNTTLYASKYDYFLITNVEKNDAWSSQIANVSMKTDLTWYPDPERIFKTGGLVSWHKFNPGNYQFGTDIQNS